MPLNGNLSVTVNYRTNVIKVTKLCLLAVQLFASSSVFLPIYF